MAAHRAGIMSCDPPSEKREGLEGATQRNEGQQVDVLMIGYISGRGRKTRGCGQPMLSYILGKYRD